MGIERTVRIDAEIVSVGQFDRTETWCGKVVVGLLAGHRVRFGNATQSGFQSITISLIELWEAVDAAGATSGGDEQ